MIIATYNVENLFDRARVMNLATWGEGREVLEQYSAANKLLGKLTYTASDRSRLAELLIALGLERSDEARFVRLRRNRGKLLKRPKTGGIEITAAGRGDWAGSLELVDEPVDEQAMRNTAQVIRDLKADVLAIVEAEHRPGLCEFSETLLKVVGGTPYRHVMVVDGNDDRGIDVGILTGERYPIERICSHVDDRDAKGDTIFSRDCPEYTITSPTGNEVTVLVNHFKSKGYGSTASSNARRQAQAQRVAEIYKRLKENGHALVAVAGDLNDTPGSAPLSPLLDGTDLKDIFEHPAFDKGGYPGTYGLCNASNKIDYLLLSPELFQRVKQGGVLRMGMWPGSSPRRWECYKEVKRPEDAASDHAAIWAEIDV
jgi:endonuclease/exonuclease/phosphatase family metal-dependent hydrolase